MLDFVDLEADIDDRERRLLETTRAFVDAEIRPIVDRHYLDGTFPVDLVPKMGELDLFGPNLDGYGSPEVSETAYGLLMQELEAGDSGFRSMASVQGALVMYPIQRFGSRAQRDRWLRDMRRGEAIGSFALTEPDHGSNPAGMETSVERDGDGYRLNGHKRWTTNGPIADVSVVWARDESTPGSPVCGFLVETDRDGVDMQSIDGKYSLRASSSGEVVYDDVYLPAETRLPGVDGMKAPLACLTQARYGIAWGAVGAARDAYEEALAYATDREQFGEPIAGFQLQQRKLAEMATQITLAQLLAYRLATLKERGDLTPEQVSMAKRNNVRMARDQSRIAREMLGANGILEGHSPVRHMANMETVYTYEGTHDIHTLILGQELTGLSAFD
jgi:glutaryl-CoA dehydrogenase